MIARDAQVKKMGLIHYSPRYSDAQLRFLADDARKAFPKTILTKDRMCFPIALKD